MSDKPYVSPARLEERREHLVEELTRYFAHDHLDTEEFERRLDRAYQARSLQQLDELKADLPALPTEGAGTVPGVNMARSEEVRERQFVFAMMGGTERKGVWTPARNLEAVAIMGGVELDFREARFAPGVTQLNALAIMGGVEILVPPGLRVECSGFGIMGGFEGRDQVNAPSGAPTLRINGLAIMGGVEVIERLPGETSRDAKRRLKAEREEKRRLQAPRRGWPGLGSGE